MPVLLSVCALWSCAAYADETNMRLRIAWGGGAHHQWQGTIAVSEGTLTEPLPLGIEPDEPGSIRLEQGTLRIAPGSPRTYDGVDILVTAPLSANLQIELSPRETGRSAERVEIPLSKLVADFHSSKMDEQNNWLLVRRAPGDQLRVQFDRDSLVFSPDEQFDLRIQPHLVGLPAETVVRCKVQLLSNWSGKEFWSEEKELRAAADGSVAGIGPLAIKVPDVEGVYDIAIALTPWRLTTAFVRSKPVVERRVQLVVIDDQPAIADVGPWQQELEIDPAHAGWLDRVKRLSQWSVVPGFGKKPLSNDKAAARPYGGQTLIQLEVGGWQAYPLPISRPDQPHILEVEYPGDFHQSLGISIVEPNAAGAVTPIGLDSGVDIPEPLLRSRSNVQSHRLVFWPRTKTPLVLLTNRRDDRPAVFGKLRVLTGPTTLPAAMSAADADERLVAAYFDKPLFPETFSAAEALDSSTNRTLDDWSTFYLGGRRLCEYLKYAGYNGAMISVACEGSAIFPSKSLEPTAKYDSGTFFVTGQDPLRKDVLEMLFRLCDSGGLKLIPAVQFSCPLPELEALRQGQADIEGLELVDTEGKTWLARHGTHHGLAPYYNPLDPRVQQAMIAVVAELVQRYAQHPSFAGIALQMGPDTYAQLPGDEWGFDAATTGRFAKEQGVKLPGEATELALRAKFLRSETRKQWLAWRAAKLAEFHIRIQEQVVAGRPGSRLYLAGPEIFNSLQMQYDLRPTLPPRANFAEAMLKIGIDTRLYEKRPEIVLLRPERFSPLAPLAAQAVELELNRTAEAGRLFGRLQHPGSLFYHEPSPLRVPSFDAVSPFGPAKTYTWLVPNISPSGFYNRQRFVHSLASVDIQSFFDGGWTASLGQEESLRELAEVYRQLPAEPFDTIPGTAGSQSPGVVVRRLARDQQTYVYVLNDAPWPAIVEMEMRVPLDCRMEPVGSRKLPSLQRDGRRTLWKVELQPYDLVAAVIRAGNVPVENWRTAPADPEELEAELSQRIQHLRVRADSLRSPQPLARLTNAGFEQPEQSSSIVGWIHARGDGITVAADTAQARSGRQSLHLASTSTVAWVRSEPFEVPKTGRLTVWAWLRIADAQKQPPLRLAIEGRLNGEVYYKFANVGAGKDAWPLRAGWAWYVFPVSGLPPSGLEDLRVGFDLMGAGEVWIDDVQLFDVWFHDTELEELVKNIALADLQISRGNAAGCQQFLDSYWPRFLNEHVKINLTRVAANPAPQQQRQTLRQTTPPPEPKDPSMIERFKGMLPHRIFPF